MLKQVKHSHIFTVQLEIGKPKIEAPCQKSVVTAGQMPAMQIQGAKMGPPPGRAGYFQKGKREIYWNFFA